MEMEFPVKMIPGFNQEAAPARQGCKVPTARDALTADLSLKRCASKS